MKVHMKSSHDLLIDSASRNHNGTTWNVWFVLLRVFIWKCR